MLQLIEFRIIKAGKRRIGETAHDKVQLTRAAAERHPGEFVAPARRLLGKAHRIEDERLRPYLRHPVGKQRICRSMRSCREMVAAELERTNRSSWNGGHRRIDAHRLPERHL